LLAVVAPSLTFAEFIPTAGAQSQMNSGFLASSESSQSAVAVQRPDQTPPGHGPDPGKHEGQVEFILPNGATGTSSGSQSTPSNTSLSLGALPNGSTVASAPDATGRIGIARVLVPPIPPPAEMLDPPRIEE